MKHVTADEEYTVGDRVLRSAVDAQITFRLSREFLRAHGLPRGQVTTVVAHDQRIKRHHNGVNPE